MLNELGVRNLWAKISDSLVIYVLEIQRQLLKFALSPHEKQCLP